MVKSRGHRYVVHVIMA